MSLHVLLHVLALLLWGIAAGQWVIGLTCAGLRLLAGLLPDRLSFSETQLKRAVVFCTVALALEMIAVMALNGLPAGLLLAFGWMPLPLLPLLLITAMNQTPFRWRHLSIRMRVARFPGADRVAELDAPFFITTLLAASLLTKTSAWFFWAITGLMLVWLFGHKKHKNARQFVSFALAGGLAIAIGYFGSGLLRSTQQSLEDWFVDVMSGLDHDPYQRQTSIGDLGRLKLSDRIVWRVKQSAPVQVPLLLRSGVYVRYNDGAWSAKPSPFTLQKSQFALSASKPRFVLHGESIKGKAMIPLPQFASQLKAETGQFSRNSYGIVQMLDGPPWVELAINEDLNAQALPPDANDLALPKGFEHTLQKIPEIASFKALSDRDKLSSLKQWFAEHFKYTLFLGDEQQGGRTLEKFLTTDRAGHCEYFATSTVLLLRALHVPARYVTGFSVQEYSRLEKSFVVRQRHSHAWAEAFVDGRWVEIDNTPGNWSESEAAEASFLQPLTDLWSFSMRTVGEWRRIATAMIDREVAIGLVLLVAGSLSAWLSRKNWRKKAFAKGRKVEEFSELTNSPERNFLLALEHEWTALGLPRHPAEPPRTWINRVAKEGRSVLTPDQIACARAQIDQFYETSYGLRE